VDLASVRYATYVLAAAKETLDLKTLELKVDIMPQSGDCDVASTLANLLSDLPGLKSLRLTTWYRTETKMLCGGLLSTALRLVTFPELPDLRLHNGTADGTSFRAFMQRHSATMKRLKLADFIFRGLARKEGLRQTFESSAENVEHLEYLRRGTEDGALENDNGDENSRADTCDQAQTKSFERRCRYCRRVHLRVRSVSRVSGRK